MVINFDGLLNLLFTAKNFSSQNQYLGIGIKLTSSEHDKFLSYVEDLFHYMKFKTKNVFLKNYQTGSRIELT